MYFQTVAATNDTFLQEKQRAEDPSTVAKGYCCCQPRGRRREWEEPTGRHMCFPSVLQEHLIEINEHWRRVASHQPTAGLAGQAHVVTPPSAAVGVAARLPSGWSEADLLRIPPPSTIPTLEPLCTLHASFSPMAAHCTRSYLRRLLTWSPAAGGENGHANHDTKCGEDLLLLFLFFGEKNSWEKHKLIRGNLGNERKEVDLVFCNYFPTSHREGWAFKVGTFTSVNLTTAARLE